MKRPRRPWTEDELKRAREMGAAGHFYGEIDRVLGRHAGATKQRLDGAGNGSGNEVRANPVSDSLLAEREALATAQPPHANAGFLRRSAAWLFDPTRQDRAALTRRAPLAAHCAFLSAAISRDSRRTAQPPFASVFPPLR